MNDFSEMGAEVSELKMIKTVSKSSKGKSYDVNRGALLSDYVSDDFSDKSIRKLNKQVSMIKSSDLVNYEKHLQDMDKLSFDIFALKKDIGH